MVVQLPVIWLVGLAIVKDVNPRVNAVVNQQGEINAEWRQLVEGLVKVVVLEDVGEIVQVLALDVLVVVLDVQVTAAAVMVHVLAVVLELVQVVVLTPVHHHVKVLVI